MILITRKIIEPIDNKILLITIFQLQIMFVIILFQIKNSIILIMISSLQTT